MQGRISSGASPRFCVLRLCEFPRRWGGGPWATCHGGGEASAKHWQVYGFGLNPWHRGRMIPLLKNRLTPSGAFITIPPSFLRLLWEVQKEMTCWLQRLGIREKLDERKRASMLPREGRTWCVTLRGQVRGLSRRLPSTNTFLAAAVFQASAVMTFCKFTCHSTKRYWAPIVCHQHQTQTPAFERPMHLWHEIGPGGLTRVTPPPPPVPPQASWVTSSCPGFHTLLRSCTPLSPGKCKLGACLLACMLGLSHLLAGDPQVGHTTPESTPTESTAQWDCSVVTFWVETLRGQAEVSGGALLRV